MLHAQKPASSGKRKIFIIELPSPREKASKIKVGRKLAFSQVYKAVPRGTIRATLSSENRGPRINETLRLGQRVKNDTGGGGSSLLFTCLEQQPWDGGETSREEAWNREHCSGSGLGSAQKRGV